MNKEKEQAMCCEDIEQEIRDYAFQMTKELNLRLLCDFADFESVLFVEGLVITEIE